MINEIHDMVLNDLIKLCKFIETTCMSPGSVVSILHEKLYFKKVSARCAPHFILVEDKLNNVVDSVAGFCCHPDSFLHWYTTLWNIYSPFHSESKQLLQQYVAAGKQKLWREQRWWILPGNVMAMDFVWDAHNYRHQIFTKIMKMIGPLEIMRNSPHLQEKCAHPSRQYSESMFELLLQPLYFS